jgi:signal transduction histidine kinase
LRDLLEYGRVCSAEIFSSKVDLESVIKALLNEASGEIQEKSAVIEVAKPLPPVWADARMVREIILQMLNNALKFSRPGVAPEIRISAEPRDGRIRLWMQDNGVGIDSEHFDRIFRVFERLHVHEHLSGTGIGLAIVRRAAERSGGAAGVESRVGKGSRFWVEFPAA